MTSAATLAKPLSASPRATGTACFIHVGLPKTATTTLQDYVFDPHSQVDFLGAYHRQRKKRSGNWRDEAVREMLDEIAIKRMLQPDLEQAHRKFDEAVAPSQRSGKVPVISWEALALNHIKVRRARFENMRATFGPCKASITLRSPLKLVESVYFQFLKRTHVGRDAHWKIGAIYLTIEQWLKKNWKKPGGAPRSHLDYPRTVRTMCEIFGRENVRVFLFEDFVADQPAFLRSLSQFVGIDGEESVRNYGGKRRNDRWTVGQIETLKRIKGSWVQSFKFRFADKDRRKQMLGIPLNDEPAEGPTARAEIPQAWQDRIHETTAEGNRWLESEFGLSLGKLGYPT